MEPRIEIQQGNGYKQSIIALLRSEKLPVEDLPNDLDNFLVAMAHNTVVGAIGLEQYGDCGLLRSMVVHKDHRNKQIAERLVKGLEEKAAASGIHYMYLLTETAPAYFARKGYETITRAEVPPVLQHSSEFSHVCPQSAIVMKKVIA